MSDQSEVTVVGQGAKLEGTVVSAGSLRVDGQVKGQIHADGDVVLSPQSQVEADIRAKSVSIAGQFRGNIVVSGRAELKRGGRIVGNITSKSLAVEEGGIFDGQSVMEQRQAASPGRPTGDRSGSSEQKPEVKVP
jgi:cytoskeletal protein CcmA (bactofilin family)